MIIVKLMGGLGNQMFQYALGRAMAIKHNTTLRLDLSFLHDRTPRKNFIFRDFDLDVFDLHAEFATPDDLRPFFFKPKNTTQHYFIRLAHLFNPYCYYREQYFYFDPDVFSLPANTYLDGYWQSPKYFQHVSDIIRKDFSFRHRIQPDNDLLNQILDSDSVCINVRRGDFLNTKLHGVCDMKYFKPAIQWMCEKLDNPLFFVFSDDQEWCREKFKLPFNYTIVGEEHAGWKFSTKLQLMASCKHFIIANSSFAWWAAWLNGKRDKLVIVPRNWFTNPDIITNDLIPENWICMDN